MALSRFFNSADPCEIGEVLQFAEDHVDPNDQDSIFGAAEVLHRLSQKKDLLNDLIIEPIKNTIDESQPENIYTDATFILGSTKSGIFRLRANVWKVPKARGGKDEFEKRLYAYEAPHDHNFDFLTAGYYGSGYETDLYEYDYESMLPKVGEKVAVRFIERTNLSIGKVMMYRRSRDIHTQHPPIDLSVSVNLLVSTEDQLTRQQQYFDVHHQVSAGFVDGPVSFRVDLIEMAGHLGLQNAVEPLHRIASAHSCKRSRAAAVKSILKIAPGENESIRSKYGSDTSRIVRDACFSDIY